MFFFKRSKYVVQQIPVAKELIFIEYSGKYRYIQRWEDLLQIAPEEIERKVRAELFGATTLLHYKDYVGEMVFLRPEYKPEYKRMAPFDSKFADYYEVFGDLYDEQFMRFYEQYMVALKKSDKALYKKLRTAEKESTKQLTLYTGTMDVDAYEKQYEDKKTSLQNRIHIKNFDMYQDMARREEERQRLEEEAWEQEKEQWRKQAEQQALESSATYQIEQALKPYIESGYKLAIDTNVMIDYPLVLETYAPSIIFSKKVYDELDGLKNDRGHRGQRARSFFRYFEKLQNEGVIIPFIGVTPSFSNKLQLDMRKPDEMILASYLQYKEQQQVNVLFLSKDRGARILAKNHGLETLNEEMMRHFQEV